MVLLFDDWQWADTASAGLLFHLGRRLAGSRILIVVAYRPSEIIPSRSEPAVQLEPVIHELRRTFGNIQLDLEHFDTVAGRHFVDALLDRQPNRLSENFRIALFWRTKGHPLFTLELLREMQARGDLVQDPDGYWVESDTLQ